MKKLQTFTHFIIKMKCKIIYDAFQFHKTFPALKCEDKNAEYRPSGPGCPATCLDPDAEDTCTLEPTEGCFCKAGFVLSDGACVPRDQCGCKNDKGDYFPVELNIFIHYLLLTRWGFQI